ncbi:hypothetical protein LIER_00734 [Lithospermum erythrorhizon]|uniref:CCHC-type domain-containing protein n=1 Tax=Lithospermum erythrorhizon TaxID=34254 RepID=A0AAV3NIG4_LITER
MEQDEFRALRDNKRGRQDTPRSSGQGNSGFQGRPFQRSRFSALTTNSRFSSASSMPQLFNRFGGSRGSYHGRQGNGGCFRCGRTNHRIQGCRQREVICYRCRQLGHIATNCSQFQATSSGTDAFTLVQQVRGDHWSRTVWR